MLLLEREQQLLTLAQWHEAALSKSGCVVFVTGEAGIGKTALIGEFVQQRGPKLRPLWGSCDPLSTPQPLGPLRDVSRQVGGTLQEAMTEGTNRARIFTAVLDELENARDGAVLIVEDVHWADEATLDLLRYLGRRIARTRAMVIVTYRDDEVDSRHPLQSAIGHLPGEVVRRLSLPRLSEAAVAALVGKSGHDSAGLHAATVGNPFYVTEVLATPSGSVPASVRDAVLARIGRLSPAARQVAELAALVPGRIEAPLIRKILGFSEEVIDECSLSGMTRDRDGALAFRHELSRRAVEDSLAPAQARAWHEQILQALASGETGEVSESRLVHHAQRADNVAAVLKHAPRAAERAAGIGAHREAIAYFQAALRYEQKLEPPLRARLLDGLGYECYLVGDFEAGMAARTRALELWRAARDVRRAGDALRWLSRLSWFRGRGEDTDRFAMQAVATLEPLGECDELAMAFSNVSQLAMLSAHRAKAIEWGERAIRMAERLGNHEILAHALNNVGVARLQTVGDAGWLEVKRSLEIAQRHGFQEHVARAYTNLFSMAVTHRAYAIAREHGEEGVAYCTEYELDAWELYIRAYRARALFEQGRWDEAMKEAQELLVRPGLAVPQRLPALAVVARVRARRGDEDVDAPLDEALSLAAQTQEAQRIGVVAAARAEVAWLRGDPEGAAREAQRGLEPARQGDNKWMLAELSFWIWRAAAPGAVAMPQETPYRLHMQGDCAGAAAAWAAIGCPYEEADALAESREVADRRRALEIFESLGARPMARKLRKELQAQGVKGLKRGAHRSTRANPAGLTAREVQILSLLAQDLSNASIARKLYLSVKTVGHHASAILAKLGVSSRREAADAARKLGIELSGPQ